VDFLGWRRITPRRGERLPSSLAIVPAIDTGGSVYRPSHRPQDPAKDPDEPSGGESSSRGSDHGWSNCTMSSGADALAYHTRGDLAPWGGRLRHKQGDLDGGTDLYDLRDAWAAYGETLTIKSGAGWAAVYEAHEAGRAIVIQGTGEVPGSGDFDGGHACAIGIETRSDGAWLFGDPLASGWQWIHPSSIKTWAQRWQSSIAFAVSAVVVEPDEPDEPDPPPDPPPPPPAESYTRAELEAAAGAAASWAILLDDDAEVRVWLDWLRAPRAGAADRWGAGAWHDVDELLEAELDGEAPDPCELGAPAVWSRGDVPAPAAEAIEALLHPAAWDGSAWRAAAWR